MSNSEEDREEWSIFISLIIGGICSFVDFIVVGLMMPVMVILFALPVRASQMQDQKLLIQHAG